jgi:N6-adenosine-specific RNA methylase IME4
MKSFSVALVGLALAACSPPSTTHTVEVEGAPGEVARFVAAEETRKTGADIRYEAGTDKAVFLLPTPEEQSEVMLRASAAKLTAATRSETSWGFNTDQ